MFAPNFRSNSSRSSAATIASSQSFSITHRRMFDGPDCTSPENNGVPLKTMAIFEPGPMPTQTMASGAKAIFMLFYSDTFYYFCSRFNFINS